MDVVKLALVYLVASLLLKKNSTISLPEFFVHLVDNLENFNEFSWGKVVWEDNIGRLKQQAQNKCAKF